MKKIINFILSLLICSMVISCGSNEIMELKEATVAEGICKLFVEKKYEAAFTRMNESYRAGTTLEKFQSEIETYFSDRRAAILSLFLSRQYISAVCMAIA